MTWAFKRTLTVDHTLVPSNQSNFTVTVKISDGDLRTVANGGLLTTQHEIGFYSDAGLTTLLGFVKAVHDVVNGYLEAKVKLATISSTVDDVFYLGYVDPGVTSSLESKTNAWDANYKQVIAYGDGTTLDLTDLTSNGYNLTNSGTPLVAGAGGLGSGSGAIVGATNNYAERTGGTPTFGATGVGTIEVFFSAPSLALQTLVGIGGTTTNSTNLDLRADGKIRVACNWASGLQSADTTGTYSAGVWTYAGVGVNTRNARKAKIGTSASVANANDAGAYTVSTIETIMARNFAGTRSQYANGVSLGEHRVSSTYRSDDWMTTVANSLVSYATFITIGAKTGLSTNVLAGVGVAALAGLAPTVSVSSAVNVTPAVGAGTLAGFAPTITTGAVGTITTPTNRSHEREGQSVAFSGTGSGSWVSSIDGTIGTGTSFSTSSLSPGWHVITHGSQSIILHITAVRAINYVPFSGGSTKTQKVQVMLPANYNGSTKYPLLTYSGGSDTDSGTGANDNDNTLQVSETGGLPKYVFANDLPEDAICVFIQQPLLSPGFGARDHYWGLWEAAVDAVIAEWSVDEARIYPTGFSQGAIYLLEGLPIYASRIAAAAPVAGGVFWQGLSIQDPAITDDAMAAAYVAAGMGQLRINHYVSSGDDLGLYPYSLALQSEAEPIDANYELVLISGNPNHGNSINVYNSSAVYTWLFAQRLVGPGTAVLAATGFAPTTSVTSNINISAGVGALTVSGFAPTVTATNHQSVTPGVGVLALAGFAPAVVASNHQSALPGTGVLAATGFSPTIAAAGSQSIAAGLGVLTLTGNAPTVSVGNATLVQALTGALAAAGHAPAVTASANVSASPGTGALTVAGFAATVVATHHQVALPGTALLMLAGLAPTVIASVSPSMGSDALDGTPRVRPALTGSVRVRPKLTGTIRVYPA